MERRSILNANKDVLTVLDSHTKIQCHSKGRCMKKHHTSICEEKQDNPTQSSSYQIKENKNSNTSQSPTNTISKNTTHMGVRHMVSTETWDDLKPPTTIYNHLKNFNKHLQPPQKHLLPLANYLTSYKK